MNKYIVNQEKREKLGQYIKRIREEKGLGLNQLAIKIEIVSSLLSKLENGLTQKISPFLLKKISEGLKIDYKELYKIIGYLDEEDFIDGKLKKEYENKIKELEEKLKEYEIQTTIENNSNNGHIIVGNGNNIKSSYAGTKLSKELDELSEKDKEKVLKFINDYIKN